jgi:3-polyprenyl-4-hydroxybenzoate decarboxylase
MREGWKQPLPVAVAVAVAVAVLYLATAPADQFARQNVVTKRPALSG